MNTPVAMDTNRRHSPVSAIRYEAGVDVWGRTRDPAERRAVRCLIIPFVGIEVARGLDADGIAQSLVRAGLDVTEFDRDFIRWEIQSWRRQIAHSANPREPLPHPSTGETR